jgi:hypothetical protein
MDIPFVICFWLWIADDLPVHQQPYDQAINRGQQIFCPECIHASQSFTQSFWAKPSERRSIYVLLNMLSRILVALLSDLALARCRGSAPRPNRNIWKGRFMLLRAIQFFAFVSEATSRRLAIQCLA